MKLSEHFYLSEFTRSDTASKYGITNIPSEEETKNLQTLCRELLEPLRKAHGTPIAISSGYRCPALNSHPTIRGAATSQHVLGEAADCKTDSAKRLLATLEASGLEFDQAILYPTFLHLSYRSGRNRKQILYK